MANDGAATTAATNAECEPCNVVKETPTGFTLKSVEVKRANASNTISAFKKSK